MKPLEATEFLRKFKNSLGMKKKLARFIIFMITYTPLRNMVYNKRIIKYSGESNLPLYNKVFGIIYYA